MSMYKGFNSYSTQLNPSASYVSLPDTKWSPHILEYFDGTQSWRFASDGQHGK